MAYDGTRPRDDDFVKESAGLIRQNFEGLRNGGLVAPRPPLYGAGAPAAALGETFDRYINTTTGDEYYKGSSGWVRVSNLDAIYKSGAIVHYATTYRLDESVGSIGDLGITEGDLAQRLYVKKPSGWTWIIPIPKGSQKYQDMGSISGTKNINAASGTIVKFTVASALTVTLTALAESNHGCTLTLLVRRGGAYTVTWPQSVAWSGGTSPTFSTTETDVVTLTTINGSDWIGTVAGATTGGADTAIFTESGSIIAPPWATKALISGCAGGGGGSVGYNGRGQAGGRGGCVIDYPVAVEGGKTYSITIGVRGTIGLGGDWNGVAGGITSFDNLLSLTGGPGGAGANAGGEALSGESFCLAPSGLFGAPGTVLASIGIGNDATGHGCGGGGGYGPYNASRAGGNGSPGFLTIKWVA